MFHGLVPDLIVPAVKNKLEPALRDQGLFCLGLCCMIDAVSSEGDLIELGQTWLLIQVVHFGFSITETGHKLFRIILATTTSR